MDSLSDLVLDQVGILTVVDSRNILLQLCQNTEDLLAAVELMALAVVLSFSSGVQSGNQVDALSQD